jgi:hypothetical protein
MDHPALFTRDCTACGASHGLMDLCPEKPGYLALWNAWLRGDRTEMAWLAVCGTWVLTFLTLLALLSFIG